MNASGEAVAARLDPQQVQTGRTWFWQALVLLAITAYLYHLIVLRMVQHWWIDPNFSHGIFVPLFSAFVVWQERKRLAALPVRPSWLGLPIIAAALGILIVGVLGAELFLSRASLVLLLGGLIVQFLGWRYMRALLFPWLFLFLMIPIPAIVFNQITFPLQLLASRISAWTLTLFGIPVLREGNVIVLAAMPLEVAEACSGIRSLVSLGTLALIYGYLLDNSIGQRLALAIGAVPIAVLANSIRISGTGLVAEYWDPQKAQGFFHEFSGWVIFLVSLALLFLFHRLLKVVGRLAARRAA